METSILTFQLLDEKIEALPTPRSTVLEGDRKARWGIVLFTVSGLAGMLLAKILPHGSPWTLGLLAALLLIEIAGLVLTVPATIRDALTMMPARQRREMASEMDFDMRGYESIITWLAAFPRERLQAMSDFAAHRLGRYRSKMPVFTGSIDKLGALPVLAAIVIQFKDASWPPQISGWQIVLFGVLACFYCMSLLLVSLRFRVELYDALLKKALG